MERILLNVKEIERLQATAKLNDSQLIQKIGVNRSQYYRAKAGWPVGQKFISGVLTAFPKAKYEKVFFLGLPSHGCKETKKAQNETCATIQPNDAA